MAILHIAGALGTLAIFYFVAALVEAWWAPRVKARSMQDMSIALGVPVSSLEGDASLLPRLLEYSAQRFSGDLLRNRLSDLAGVLRTIWGWLGLVVQLCIVVGVFWSVLVEGHSGDGMWAAPAVAVFFALTSVVLSFACRLFTGRYPGEAKAARRVLSSAIEEGVARGRHADAASAGG